MRGRAYALVAILVAVAGVVVWAPAHAATVAVTLTNFSYQPGSLTVTAGTTVTFANHDAAPHSVTAEGGSFDSSPACAPSQTGGCLQPGQSFSVTFSTSGTFAYHCRVHGFMHGVVTVSAASATTTAAPTSTSAHATTAPASTTVAVAPPTTVVSSPSAATHTTVAAHQAAQSSQSSPSSQPTTGNPTASSGGLATTGLGVLPPIALGALMVGCGAIALAGGQVVRRRRRHGRPWD
jgi:plastocyanin